MQSMIKFCLGSLLIVLSATSCVKQKFDTPALAEFASSYTSNAGAYFIPNDPNTVFKVPVGITTPSNKDRVVNFSVKSSTGATEGNQYTIGTSSITIPAGKVIDSIPVKGIFAGYPTGRKDTLTFTITGGDVSVNSAASTYKLFMTKYCPVVSTDLLGDFDGTTDTDKDGNVSEDPYTATISDWTSTGATSATILIHDLGSSPDIGFGGLIAPTDPGHTGITAKLDWSNPSSFTITIPSQKYINSLLSYGQSTISGSGTFSSCDETFTIKFVVSVSLGNFDPITSKLHR